MFDQQGFFFSLSKIGISYKVRKIPFRKGDLKWQVALVYPKAQVLSPADEKFCQYLLKHFRVH